MIQIELKKIIIFCAMFTKDVAVSQRNIFELSQKFHGLCIKKENIISMLLADTYGLSDFFQLQKWFETVNNSLTFACLKVCYYL